MVIYNEAKKTIDDDRLGRKNFVDSIIKDIQKWKNCKSDDTESIVLSINSKWGNGKSSVLNFIKEGIAKKEQDLIIVSFNPWCFADKENLQSIFFHEFVNALKLNKQAKKVKKLTKSLEKYSLAFELLPDCSTVDKIVQTCFQVSVIGVITSNFADNPSWLNNIVLYLCIFSVTVTVFKGVVGKIISYLKGHMSIFSKSMRELKQDIQTFLKDGKYKILVIVDDIDRLSKQEILELFKTIRVNADFSNTMYLLAFDKEIVADALQKEGGKQYIEKIVQIPFDLPVVPDKKIHDILLAYLTGIEEELPSDVKEFVENNNAYWSNICYSGFLSFFRNLRDVKRFANGLESNLQKLIVRNVLEVNFYDFIALEALRIFTPEYYRFMWEHKDYFVKESDNEASDRKKALVDSFSLCDERYKKPIEELVKRLFPQVESLFRYNSFSFGAGTYENWGSELRVCHSDFFDIYFNFIPGGSDGAIAKSEILAMLKASQSYAGIYGFLKNYRDNSRIKNLFYRSRDYFVSGVSISLTEECVRNLFHAIMDLADDIYEDNAAIFTVDVVVFMENFLYRLFEQEVVRGKAFLIVKNAFEKTSGLFGPVRFASFLEEEKVNETLFTKEDIRALKELCIEKLEKLNFGKLLEHKHFIFIALTMEKWCVDEFKQFVSCFMSDYDQFFVFLTKCVKQNQSFVMGEYAVTEKEVFDIKLLDKFIDVETVILKIKEIRNNNPGLYAENQDIVKKFEEANSAK